MRIPGGYVFPHWQDGSRCRFASIACIGEKYQSIRWSQATGQGRVEMKRIRLASIIFAIAALAATAFADSASAVPVFRLQAKYGTYGSGEGQLRSPEGIDTDSKGNVWVADGENGRVTEFSSQGLWLMQFTGSGEHKLENPKDVATTPDGNLWVADSFSGILAEYNAKGEFLRKAVPTECGCTWRPGEVVVDSKGYVWSDGDVTHPTRIYKFNSEGVLQKYITGPVNEGITTDNGDNLWVSNGEKGGLDGYSPEGTYIGRIGELLLPLVGNATVDTEGNFWAFNGGNVRGLNAKGEYLSEFEAAKPELGGAHVLAPAENGNLWVGLLINGGQIQKWTAAPNAITGEATELTQVEPKLNGTVNPQGLATEYRFEYGKTTSYGSFVPLESVGSGYTDIAVSRVLTNLSSSTTYHFRIYASNSHGTTLGEDKTFTTPDWAIQQTEEPAETKGAVFDSVSCTSSSACAAVGYYINGAGTNVPLGKVKSGGVWSLTTTPNPGGWSYLPDVSCTASNACTAVGYSVTSGATLAERWNGSAWTIQSTPNAAGASANYLLGVSCTASNSCDAVGYSTGSGAASTLAEHWNGSTWSIVSIPNAPGYTKSYLFGMSCVSSSDCWAVGAATNKSATEAALAEHWDGTKWTVNSPASSETLNDISCGSASMCVATTKKNAIFRWNGSTWTQEAAPVPAGSAFAWLNGVSCTTATACTAVGVQGTGSPRTLAESWNGSKWSVQTTSEPAGTVQESQLDGVSCLSATSCTAVGNAKLKSVDRKTLVEVRQ